MTVMNMKLAMAQMQMEDSIDRNLAKSIHYMEQAAETGADLIFFPEAEKEAYGEIVGFGVYAAKAGGDPYFWGKLSKDSGTNGVVTVGLNEIPIFRVGDFRICLV